MKNYSMKIGFLVISALILFIAQFLPVRSAEGAATVWKDRDYTMLTASSSSGSDTVYIVDNRSGQLAVLVWDNASRAFVSRGVVPIAEAFTR